MVVGSQGGVNVALNGCSFTNMYDAVYCNQVTDAAAPVSTVTISGCTFSNVAHSYGVDDGATAGARVDKHAFALSGNTGEPAPETFAVAEVDGVGYTSLEAAVAAAAVIAKVTRDRLMVELGAQPQYEPYEWAHNKGYGSAAHRDAIAEFGPSDLHRLSWHLV